MTVAGPRKNAGKTPSGRRRGKPFGAGNPGRPTGARNKSTVAIERLLEGEAEAIGRKVVEKALEGDATALRLAMERIAPLRKGRPVRFALPALDAATDLPKALGAVLTAIAGGAVTPDEGLSLAQIIETRRRTLELVELEQRIAALETARNTER
jgi:hypothetical protein